MICRGAKNMLLEMKNIYKRFNDNPVLNGIDFYLEKGEVRALIGENGAGKSTLMKILLGLCSMDNGEIYFDGHPISPSHYNEAQSLGISMIFHSISLIPDLSVAENIFLQREPLNKFRAIKWGQIYIEAKKYLDSFNLTINPKALLADLPTSQQRFVEIVKAVSNNPKLIILDEPTIGFTEEEASTFFNLIKKIKTLGIAIVYITHRLEEIENICDSISIMRNGLIVKTDRLSNIDMETLIKLMSGKTIKERYPKLDITIGKEVLSVNNLSINGILYNINFSLKRGEILGITGLYGSGKEILSEALFGLIPIDDGAIVLDDSTANIHNSEDAVSLGLGYVAPNRHAESLFLNRSIAENISVTNLEAVTKHKLLDREKEFHISKMYMHKLQIKSPTPQERVKVLSSGDQKKIILAKWLHRKSNIMIFDEPTSGVDVAAKIDIYNIINELIRSGVSIIFISSDVQELIAMCDRIIVMCDGRMVKEFYRNQASIEGIFRYATGNK